MEALSVIRLMPESKEQVKSFVEFAVNQILSGEVNAPEIAVYLKTMEDVVKSIRDNRDIKDMLIDEVGDKLEIGNAALTVVETSKYNYTDDTRWCDLNLEIKLKTEQRKYREKMLQTLENEVADPDSGELIKPAEKTTAKSIRITLK